MMREYDSGEPLNLEPDGTYITIGQMQFYLNRPHGEKRFKTGHKDFLKYYNLCRIYNLVSEMMEDSEESAIMYWDSTKETVSLKFPNTGEVAVAISNLEFAGEPDDYDGDSWSL